ncbi:hypothetical protein SAMN02949497_1227 [Methylomagnum ishizawai]|uniref:Uncharacterized protein n=1 Tax=Methylomagnum ishizawai TaxID=1760988 RepID=A0A1Y6CU26_9GAMM|nr:hypothetical protein [Methylomagnum ishizawai]SMF93931.1 hypothetical protein SAMN02949497_1227 [Methylomagnum ishizawai]
MMDMEGVNSVLGVKYGVAIAAFLGAAVALTLSPFQGRWGWVPSISSGYLSACYFTPLVTANLERLVGTHIVVPPHSDLGVAFLIGLVGHNLARRIVAGSAVWRLPSKGEGHRGR